MCVFFYLKSHFPQRTKHNDDNHPLRKTIMSSTAGNLLCDGAALTKSPETFEDVLLSLSHDVIEIRSNHFPLFKLLWRTSILSCVLPPHLKPSPVWLIEKQACCKQFVSFGFWRRQSVFVNRCGNGLGTSPIRRHQQGGPGATCCGRRN